MRVQAEDQLAFAGYRHVDIRHDSAWVMSCVLYAHSTICLFVIMAFASYGLVWPVSREKDTFVHKTARKGTVLISRPSTRYGNVQMFKINLHFVIESSARPSRPNRFDRVCNQSMRHTFPFAPPTMERNVYCCCYY